MNNTMIKELNNETIGKFNNETVKHCNNERAFTFIELLAAIIVLAIGVLSVIAISSKSYSAISLQKNKLIATNLAKEGMELVLNVRGENWLYKDELGVVSYCIPDESSSSDCADGRLEESLDSDPNDIKNCDWRCGSKEIDPLNDLENQFFRLDKDLKDLDYTGNVEKGTGPFDSCQTQGVPIYISPDGVYRHQQTGDKETQFRRLIIIGRDKDLSGDGKTENNLQVIVKVCWQERGKWEEIWLEEHLYNWYK